MGYVGEGWYSYVEVKFNNLWVLIFNFLGREGEGFKFVQECLGFGCIYYCMCWIGICECSFDMMCWWAVICELSEGCMFGEK